MLGGGDVRRHPLGALLDQVLVEDQEGHRQGEDDHEGALDPCRDNVEPAQRILYEDQEPGDPDEEPDDDTDEGAAREGISDPAEPVSDSAREAVECAKEASDEPNHCSPFVS